jgi:hypothetical protein
MLNYRRLLILIYFTLLIGLYFIINIIAWLGVQFVLLRKIEMSMAVLIAGLMFTIININKLYKNGKIEKYFRDAEW